MALKDFWTHVHTGAGLFSPTVNVIGSAPTDTANLQRIVQNADLWLTPKTVEGLDEADIEFFSRQDKEPLRNAIRGFLEIASQVPSNRPATPKQADAASQHFRVILGLLNRDRYADADAFDAGKRIEHRIEGQMPKWVHELRFESGRDVSGDPALWIWVIGDDDAFEGDKLSNNTAEMREILRKACDQLDLKYWPYVRFRSTSEQASLTGSQQ